MPALNFHARFAEQVRTGKKRCTIRGIRKRPIKKGDDLYFYTGQRTKNCQRLRFDICESAEEIVISINGEGYPCVFVNGKSLTNEEVYSLAIADGFDSEWSFLDFFKPRIAKDPNGKFHGQLIKW